MSQLSVLKSLVGEDLASDDVFQFYLDCASDVICDIRNSNTVETKYLNIQIKIAIELFQKRGAEGQTGHSENGLARTYEKADISDSLIRQITPIVKTPFSAVRVVE